MRRMGLLVLAAMTLALGVTWGAMRQSANETLNKGDILHP
jgi:hypothetical protein